MGICNNKTKEKEISYSTKAILQPQKFEKMSFYFSTQNLLRLDADCLVIFCDQKMNLNKNIYLSQIGKTETRKIAEFAQAQLLKTKTKLYAGQTLIFPIKIACLRFKFICLGCLKIWDGREKIASNIQKIIQNMFTGMQKNKIQSIALTEFNECFGIPMQLGCKIVVERLEKCKEWLKVVTFICNDIGTQGYYMEKINQIVKGMTALPTQQPIQGNIELENNRISRDSEPSNYY